MSEYHFNGYVCHFTECEDCGDDMTRFTCLECYAARLEQEFHKRGGMPEWCNEDGTA